MYDMVVKEGKIFLKEYKLTKSISLKELSKQLVKLETSIETPPLPQNTYKFSSKKTQNTYVIKIPQGFYNIMHAPRGTRTGKQLTVCFPSTFLVFKFDSNLNNPVILDVRIYWSLTEEFKDLYNPPLPNIYDDGRLCMGNYDRGNTQSASVEKYIKAFFENVFNQDISGGKRDITKVARQQKKAFDDGKDMNFIQDLWWDCLRSDGTKLPSDLVNMRHRHTTNITL